MNALQGMDRYWKIVIQVNIYIKNYIQVQYIIMILLPNKTFNSKYQTKQSCAFLKTGQQSCFHYLGSIQNFVCFQIKFFDIQFQSLGSGACIYIDFKDGIKVHIITKPRKLLQHMPMRRAKMFFFCKLPQF